MNKWFAGSGNVKLFELHKKVQKLSFTHLAITRMEFQKYDSYDFL